MKEEDLIGNSFKRVRNNGFPFENFGIFWSDIKLAKNIFEGK